MDCLVLVEVVAVGEDCRVGTAESMLVKVMSDDRSVQRGSSSSGGDGRSSKVRFCLENNP